MSRGSPGRGLKAVTLSPDVLSGAPAVRMTVAPLSLTTLLSPSPPPPAVSGPSGPPPPRPAGFWKVPPSPAPEGAQSQLEREVSNPQVPSARSSSRRSWPGADEGGGCLVRRGGAQGRPQRPGEEGLEPRSSEAGEEALGRWPGPAPPDPVTPERLPA